MSKQISCSNLLKELTKEAERYEYAQNFKLTELIVTLTKALEVQKESKTKSLKQQIKEIQKLNPSGFTMITLKQSICEITTSFQDKDTNIHYIKESSKHIELPFTKMIKQLKNLENSIKK